MRNYIYELVCEDDRGWLAGGDEALWGYEMAAGGDRLFANAAAAHRAMRATLAAGCWSREGDDGETVEDPPQLAVERRAVHEFLWGDHDEDVIERVIELRGGPVAMATMPVHVARFLIAKYTGRAGAWSRQAASLAGASSATHTARIASARFAGRVEEIRALLRARGIATAPAEG